VRWGTVVGLLAGCNQIYGLSPTTLADARPDAIGCSGQPFVGVQPLLQRQNADIDPTLSEDGLEIWFATEVSGPSQHIRHATRRTVNDPFVEDATVPPFSDETARLERSPSITIDRLRMLFVSNRPMGNFTFHVFEATRTGVGQPFGPATQVASLGSGMETIDISPDGLTVYLGRNGNLEAASRPRVEDPFGAPITLAEAVAAANAGTFPSISPDGKEIFFAVEGDLVSRVRGSVDEVFAPSTQKLVLASAHDGDVTFDNRGLVYASVYDVYMATRDCPPGL
jgi:hypothetical protein